MTLRQGSSGRWKVLAAAAGALVVAGVGAVGLPPASAAPLPATYFGSAVGDLLTLNSTLIGATLADTDLVHGVATVNSASPGAPTTSTSANFGLRVGPIAVGSANTETAPPTHSESGSFLAAGVPGLLSTGLITYTDSVRWDGASSCAPLGVPLSSAVTETAGASLDLLGVEVVDTGVASVTTSTGLVALSPIHDTRGLATTTQGSVAGLSLLNGTVTVSALQPSLTTTATDGVATSANLSGSAVTVTGPAGTVSLAAGATVNITVPLVGSVALRLSSNADVVSNAGRFSTTYLTATVSLLAGTGTVSIGVLPISVSATAPAGGIECDTTAPAVAITAPADGSTTGDTTPAVTGTSEVISGTVSLVVDGGTPVTVPTDASGGWTYTPATPLAEGPHSATVTATDAAGNSASDSVDFTVDVVPAVDITAPVAGSTTGDATPTVTGTSTTATGTVSLAVDGGAPITVTTAPDGSWSWTPPADLSEGPHTVVATAADGQGNSVSDSVTFTVDTIAPTIAITAPADGSTTNDPTPTITGTSDVLSGTVDVAIDGGAPVTVATDASGNWSSTPTTLADGPHTVVATAADAAGNTTSDTTDFTVDTVAPAIAITAPADGSTTNDSAPAITGTSDVLSGSITLVIDGGAPITVNTDATGAWSHTPPTALVDGPHSVVATATDAAGNTTSDVVAFTTDSVAPAIAITTPADGSSTSDPTPAITGTSDVLSGSIELVIDGGTPITVNTDASGAWSYTPPTALAEGPHTVAATATDAAGNTTSDTTDFTVDTVAPAIAITAPADGSTTNDSTPAITGTSDVPSGSIQLVIDGGAPISVPTDASGNWSHTPPTALADGPHSVVATASDAAGNSTSDVVAFTVDTVAPAIAITAPADASSTSDPTPAITGTSDVLSGSIQLVIDGGAPVTVPTDASGNWSYTPPTALSDGPHTIAVTATDAAGNSTTDNASFTVNTVDPTIAITAPADGSTTSDPTPAITGTSDVLSGSIQLVIDGGAPITVPTDATGSWSHTPPANLADGPHTVVATATDATGNTTSDETAFTVAAPAAVDVTITSPADGSSTTDPTPLVTGTTVPGGTVLVSVDGGPAVSVRANGSGEWTYEPDTLTCGQHTVTATVGTGADAVTATSSFTVLCASATPNLPLTGSTPAGLVGLGLLLVGAGGAALALARRRATARDGARRRAERALSAR